MKLTVLVDNNTLIDRYYEAEPGLSFFIEDDGKKILFDAGFSRLFIKNASKMGIDLKTIDYMILSHGHLDHSWGIFHLLSLFTESAFEKKYYEKPILMAHPLALNKKISPKIKEMGSIISEDKLSAYFDIQTSKTPVFITENLVFLGEISRKNDFEGNNVVGKTIIDNVETDDKLYDDTAMVYKSDKGLVIITGCSHSGICNIIEYAKEICKDDRIYDVVGGFHLLNPDSDKLNKTLDYMKKLDLTTVHACHCTDLKSKIALSKISNIEEVGVGLELSY